MVSAFMAMLLLATPAIQQAPPPQQQPEARRGEPTASPAQDDGAKVVCRREQIMGSNRFRRVCRTQADIEMRRERTQQDLERRLDWEPNPADE